MLIPKGDGSGDYKDGTGRTIRAIDTIDPSRLGVRPAGDGSGNFIDSCGQIIEPGEYDPTTRMRVR
jgi:hypothetical protein